MNTVWNGCPSDSPDGFTLLEVLVALSLIAITVIGVYGLQLQNLRLAESSRFDTRAVLAIDEAMAALATQDLAKADERSSDLSAETGSSLRWHAEIRPWPEAAGDGTPVGLYQIRLTVSDEGDRNQLTLMTYRFGGAD